MPNDPSQAEPHDQPPRAAGELLHSRAAQAPRFEFVQVERETLLYDNQQHDVIYLDQTATLVWLLCDGARRVADIVQLLEAAYPDCRDAIAQDVQRTICELAERGALLLQA